MLKKILKTATWLAGILFWGLLICGIAGITVLVIYLYRYDFFATPDISLLNNRHATTIFLDDQGERIREICTYCRELATLEEMGHFPAFAIAVEDKNFETRFMPYDWKGVLRAAWRNLIAWETKEGSSTITNQVGRNVFLEKELKAEWSARSPEEKRKAKWWRKFREAWVSAYLEYTIGKENRWKILEAYLNTAYCGRNLYGVKSCSRYYFGKEPKELDPAQTAWIILLWRSPRFWMLEEKNINDAKLLRSRVLTQLAEEKKISWLEKDEFEKHPLPKYPADHERDPCRALHAAESARLIVKEKTKVADAGLEIHTTINCGWNRGAALALEKSLAAMRERNPQIKNDLWGVAMAIDTRNGDIKILTQNPPFSENEYRAEQIKRHAGSAAKPYGILAYLVHGGHLECAPETAGRCTLNDSSGLSLLIKTANGYKRKYFQNFPYEGDLPRYLETTEPILCLAESRNACFLSMIKGISGGIGFIHKDDLTETLIRLKIRLPETKGPDILSEPLAKRTGLKREFLDPGHTGIIGSFDISAYEMVRSWSAFYGKNMVEPRLVDRVLDDSGELLGFPPIYHGNILANIWIEAKKEEMRWAEVNRLSEIYQNKSRNTIYRTVFDQMVFPEDELRMTAITEADNMSLELIRGLRAAVEFEHGTGKLARLGDESRKIPKLDFQIACKTGTATNQNGDTTDNWIACRTISHVMVVWIGRKNKSPMKTLNPVTGREIQETGGGNALPVLIEAFSKIYETYPKENFPDETDPMKPFRNKIDSRETAKENDTADNEMYESLTDRY